MSDPIHVIDHSIALENEQLRFALQAAGVGTWDYNLLTGQVQWSALCRQLFGLPADAQVTAPILLEQVHPHDRERVSQANARALNPDAGGEHNIIFRTLNPQGTLRWVHAKGQTVRGEQGQLIRFSGIVQDVTQQVLMQQQAEETKERFRQLAQQLDGQVQERTAELATANEQLASANDELSAMNEELTQSNQATLAANDELAQANYNLTRSNQNLEQFAYVASHDLQEPLRKIQQFGDLLESQYGERLGEGVDYIKRMQAAASRMSILIRDLLAYSRITTRRQAFGPVSLYTVLTNVLGMLEWSIAQSGAQVEVGELPIVKGDASQLGQLFQNLLANAIKFTPPGQAPFIQVSSRACGPDELPVEVRASNATETFYEIWVRDEGIGFDTKYLDRIFQVFQRLHSKTQYAGSGVGLAICQRVVENHGGAITASSKPGEGATFYVYLPACE